MFSGPPAANGDAFIPRAWCENECLIAEDLLTGPIRAELWLQPRGTGFEHWRGCQPRYLARWFQRPDLLNVLITTKRIRWASTTELIGKDEPSRKRSLKIYDMFAILCLITIDRHLPTARDDHDDHDKTHLTLIAITPITDVMVAFFDGQISISNKGRGLPAEEVSITQVLFGEDRFSRCIEER